MSYVPRVVKETAADKARDILRAAGFTRGADITGPNGSVMQFFHRGNTGTVILQSFDAGESVITYADWPMGTTFDELAAALKP